MLVPAHLLHVQRILQVLSFVGNAISLQRVTYGFGNSLHCLRVPMEFFWPIRCNPIMKLEASVGDKRWPVESLLYPLFGNLSKIALYLFQEASSVLGFHTTPKMTLNFSALSLYSFCSPPHFILSFSTLHIYP